MIKGRGRWYLGRLAGDDAISVQKQHRHPYRFAILSVGSRTTVSKRDELRLYIVTYLLLKSVV